MAPTNRSRPSRSDYTFGTPLPLTPSGPWHYPMWWVFVAFALGIVLSDACLVGRSAASAWCLAGAVVPLVACLFLLRRRRPVSAVLWVVLLAVSIASSGALLLLHSHDRPAAVTPADGVTLRLRTDEEARRGPTSWSLRARLVDGPQAGTQVTLWLAADSSRLSATPPLPGDLVMVRGRLDTLRPALNPEAFDYAAWQRRQGIQATVHAPAGAWRSLGRSPNLPLWLQARRLRHDMVARYAHYMDGEPLALMAALTLGDRSQLQPDLRDPFARSGVSHVLALSGLHLSFLFALFQWLVLRRMTLGTRRYALAAVVGVVLMWGYVLVAGMPLSLVRAAVMFSLAQVFGLCQRTSLSVANLSLAATAILVWQPQALFDVGYQLSVVSVLSILVFVPYLPCPALLRRHVLSRQVFAFVSVSVVAQVGTAPLVAYHFHAVPVYGLLGNLVAVPAASLLLVFGLLFFLLPWWRPFVADAVHVVSESLLTVLRQLGRLPGASLSFQPSVGWTICAYFAFLAVALSLTERPWRRRMVWAAVLGVMVTVAWGVVENRRQALSPQLVIYHTYRSAPVHFLPSADSTFVWSADAAACRADSAALAPVRRTYWTNHALPEPRYVSADGRYGALYLQGSVAQCGPWRVARLCRPLRAADGLPQRPLAVSHLLLDGRYRGTLADALRRYRPQMVVLSPALPVALRDTLALQAAAHHLPVHDIARHGALVVPQP